jgi:catechol 2,3-dioxygenase-like lactoylglutathione lyase family enzyme
MAASGMNHFTVLTDDVEGTVRFYGELLGLVAGPRPDFTFPGAWLYVGANPILHLIGGRAKPELKPGVIDHIAFSGDDLAGTLAALKAHNVEHTCRRQVDSGVWQVFFFDPNGAKVEVDFASGEQPGA